MIKRSTLFSIAAIVFSVSGTAIASGDAPTVGDAESGKALSASCAACHGNDGNSPAPSFPKIAGLGEKYLYKQLQDIQSGARAIVAMTGQLDNKSEQDLKDLAAYFDSQAMQLSGAKEMKVKVNSGIEVDALALGERVYRAGNSEVGVPSCMGCHSPRGLGNAPAGYPRLSGQYAEYIALQLRNFRAGERTNDGDSKIMRSVAEHMSDAEIDAVANYISGLN
ncbi:Cytochrome c4 [gamma proteobacterium IMCC1989]|jgi:cytochrome c553|nr:Cytochrome c4 [gamma proteobacterium IMCC1989]